MGGVWRRFSLSCSSTIMSTFHSASATMEAESSIELFERARAGDTDALNALLARYLPRLRRWATCRLPAGARDLQDTQDIVQETLIHALRHFSRFEFRGEGSLQAYLRQSLLHRITDAYRRASRQPANDVLHESHAAAGPSPLEEAIGQETLERYERALEALTPEDREAIVMRLELGCSYPEIATSLGKPSPDAARVAVSRAVARLAGGMRRES
jgi:RNA polymerase sigma-70 factor, ECF subfamily